MSTVVKL